MRYTLQSGTRDTRALRIYAFIFGMVFVFFSSAILISLVKESRLCTKEATGVVVGNRSVESSDDDGTYIKYYPVIMFTVDGESFEVGCSEATKDRAWNEGMSVDIKYNPNNPKQIILPSNHSSSFVVCIIALIAGSLVSVSGLMPESIFQRIYREPRQSRYGDGW